MNLAREPVFRLGAIEVRPATREIVHPGGRETVEPRVMSVLVRFAQAGGQVVTRDDLIAACWEGRVVSDDAINRVISRVRKLSDLTGGRDFSLETITKVGYRLVVSGAAEATPADVRAVEQPAPAAPASIVGGVRRYWLVAVGAVIAGLLGAWAFWGMNQPQQWVEDPSAPLTLAVLPFDNLGGVAGDETLANGLAREIRNTLSRVRGLRVVSDSSSFAVAGEPLTATEMGRRLNADLLLDGSLIRSGDGLRLTVELVDGEDGVNLWTGGGSGQSADMESLRQQVSAEVVEQLVVRLGPKRIGEVATQRRSDPRAYRMLIEAQELLQEASTQRLRGLSEESLLTGERAELLVEQALVIEPASPMALLLKARIIATAATHERQALDESVLEKQALAADYLRRALASDPDYAPALGALGEYYRRYQWNWESAGAMLERAVALDPNQADVRLSYSYFLSGVGRCVEAVEHARAAVEIDPEFGWRTFGVPRALKCAGRPDEAVAVYLDLLRREPANPVILRELYLGHVMRGDADGLDKLRAMVRDELWKGQPPEFVRQWLDGSGAAARALRENPSVYVNGLEAVIRQETRMPKDVSFVTGLRDRGDMMWVLAIEYGFLGETERAVDLLAASVAHGTLYIPETMPYGAFEFTPEMRADPSYQAIWRSDPRLIELVALRRQAVEAGQMHGRLSDGREVMPKSDPVDSRS